MSLAFDIALSSLEDNDFLKVARKYQTDSKKTKLKDQVDAGRLAFLIDTKERLSTLPAKYKSAKTIDSIKKTHYQITSDLNSFREEMEIKIMRKIFPDYWPTHRNK